MVYPRNLSPRSLLQIANAPLNPAPLDLAAMLLIDPQLEYVSGCLPLTGVRAAVDAAARLLSLCRARSVPIFHILHHGRAGGPAFDPEKVFVRSIPELVPRAGETTVIKLLPNSFAHTELQALIDRTGRKELIIAGFATHMCVSATTRAALDLGYRNTVVAAATATRDLPNPLGGVTRAEIVHEATLAALADRFAVVVRDECSLVTVNGI